MAYKPKVGDTVRIRDYNGMLHPMTIWFVKETRPDLSLVNIPVRTNGLLDFTNEHWVENDRLIKTFVPIAIDPSIRNA